VLILTALCQGPGRFAAGERLRALYGITRSTLIRWRRYFLEVFPQSPSWRWLAGRFMPPPALPELPGALITHFVATLGEPCSAMVACLKALALGP
jgi:hypothetical protein